MVLRQTLYRRPAKVVLGSQIRATRYGRYQYFHVNISMKITEGNYHKPVQSNLGGAIPSLLNRE